MRGCRRCHGAIRVSLDIFDGTAIHAAHLCAACALLLAEFLNEQTTPQVLLREWAECADVDDVTVALDDEEQEIAS